MGGEPWGKNETLSRSLRGWIRSLYLVFARAQLFAWSQTESEC